jgi:hypothetical protein
MQSERVFIAIISTVVVSVVAAVVATTIVVASVVAAAIGAYGSLLLGHLIPNVEVLSSLPVAAHELRLRSLEKSLPQ